MKDHWTPHFEGKFSSFLILGPPGSGKGTLGKFLSHSDQFFHLSTGEVFRGISPDSEVGKIYHQYAMKGLLLPDEVTIEVCRRFVEGLIATNRYFPTQQHLLLDGVPRTLTQAKLLEPYIEVQKVIVLELEQSETLMQRMQRRGLIEKRKDDLDVELLRKRLAIYEKETKPLLQYYDSKKILRFNASQTPLALLRDVLTQLCSLGL